MATFSTGKCVCVREREREKEREGERGTSITLVAPDVKCESVFLGHVLYASTFLPPPFLSPFAVLRTMRGRQIITASPSNHPPSPASTVRERDGREREMGEGEMEEREMGEREIGEREMGERERWEREREREMEEIDR